MKNIISKTQDIISKIPVELWFGILKYTNIKTIGKIACVNKRINDVIYSNLWGLIDQIFDNKSTEFLIPKYELTYNRYIYIIDWSDIIMNCKNMNTKIPESTIMWIKDNRDLGIIALYQDLSEDLIRLMYKKIPISTLLSKQKVPIDIICNIINEYELSISDWYNIWLSQDINYKFVLDNIDNIQWFPVSTNKTVVSFEFINRFGDNIIWQEFTKHSIHENILERYISKFDFICWDNICTFTQLSDEFIERHFNYFNKFTLIRFQELSEEIVNRILSSYNEDYIISILSYQKVSKEFIINNINFVSRKSLIKNKHIPRSTIHLICKMFKI